MIIKLYNYDLYINYIKLLLMISFIMDICNIPHYITQKLSHLPSAIKDFFLPTSLQHNSELPEEENNIESDFAEQDNTNIFNQQNNQNYLLQGNDIYLITQHQNINILPIAIQDIVEFNKLKAYQHHATSNRWINSLYKIMNGVERIFTANKNYKPAGEALVTAIKSLYLSSELATGDAKDHSSLKSQHFIVNLDYNHWTCLSLVKNKEDLYILYKDSMGISPDTKTQIELYIKNIAQYEFGMEGIKVKFIANTQTEQQDLVSCGIFALKNIQIIQQELSGENPETFLENFAESKEFCKSEVISKLRTKYAKESLHSQIKSILLGENNKMTLTKDYLKQGLKENLSIAHNSDLEAQINTYVDSYNPNAQLEVSFSSIFYSPIWLLNKHYPKSYTFHHNTTYPQISGAESENPEKL